MTAQRFTELWDAHGHSAAAEMTPAELADIDQQWDKLDGSSCWIDAFHAAWRAVDPAGHKAKFGGKFYETAERMQADDDECVKEDVCTACGSECRLLGYLGRRRHYRCRSCGLDSSIEV